MLLAVYTLALSLVLGASNAAPPAAIPQLPPTQPGLSHDEGVFLVTAADDGSQAIYFIAGNSRHGVLAPDMQLELQANPLWPVRQATQEEVLGFAEGAPIGGAHAGLLGVAPAPAPVEPAPAQAAPAPVAQAPVAQAPDDAQPLQVTLRPGDNLTRIAAQYGTSVDAILAANGLANANRIYAGASLVIPTADMPIAPAETAAPAETTETAEAATPQADITPQAQAPQADTNPQTEGPANTYTVAPGDSAFKIARRFGVDQQALLDANNISNPNRVYAGQVLTIPS